MTRVAQLLSAFNAGEWSPEMSARTDLEKYPSACQVLENFVPLVEGPARRRGGTRWTSEVKDSTVRGWTRRFEFSATQAYVLEFGDRYVRFYTNHGAVLETAQAITAATQANPVVITCNAHGYSNGDKVFITGVQGMRPLNGQFFIVAGVTANTFQLQGIDGTAYPAYISGGTVARVYTIASSYAVADLTNAEGCCTLRTFQSGDVIYIACRVPSGAAGYKPQQLTRFADTNWTFTQYAPTNGPFLELNTSTTALWASGQTGSVTLTASSALFAATDVGRLVRLESKSISVLPWESGKAITAGSLIGVGTNIYKAMNAATTGTLPPTHIQGSAFDGVTGVQWQYQHSGYGIVQITAFTNATTVTATVVAAQPGGVPLLPADVVGTVKSITGITQANPAVVTSVAHGFSNQDNLFIFGVAGMTQVNGNFYVASGVAASTFNLTGTDSTGYSAYTSGGTVVKNATTDWQLGAWSDTTEYPATVAFFRDRLVWGGKLRLWATVVNDFANMAPDDFGLTTAANALSEILQAEDVNNIVWLVPADRLLIGTTGGEFAMSEITSAQPLGPGNVKIERQSRKRCRSVQPVVVGIATLYVQRAGRKLMSMVYSFYIDKYQSSDQTAFARHAQKPYIIDMAYQSEPNSVIWCVRSDGQLIAMTLEQEQQVVAWHRHPLGGSGFVESVTVIPAPDGTRDEVWVQVRRTINGVTRRYIEFVEKDWDSATDLVPDMFYVDAGATFNGLIGATLTWPTQAATVGVSVVLTAAGFNFISADIGRTISVPYLTGPDASGNYTAKTAQGVITAQTATTATITVTQAFPLAWTVPVTLAVRTLTAQSLEWGLLATQLTGLGYLEGQSVQVLRDGAESLAATVVNGAITLEKPTLKAQVGLQCTARLVTMRLEGGSQNGTAQGKVKRVHECTVRFMDTIGGKLGPFGGKLDTLPFRTTGMAMDTPIPSFTGDKRVPFAGDYGRDDNQLTPNSRVEYRQDLPFAATVVGIIPNYTAQD